MLAMCFQIYKRFLGVKKQGEDDEANINTDLLLLLHILTTKKATINYVNQLGFTHLFKLKRCFLQVIYASYRS